jgi:hypothetical protein
MTESKITFAQKKGANESERLVDELMKLIAQKLNGETIALSTGRICEIRVVGEATHDIMFDIKQPSNNLSHIEFKITETGWGMNL